MSRQAQKDVVLVLDGDMVPALTIARSLGRMGITVVIGSHTAKPLAGYSRHVRLVVRYPDPLLDETEFLAWGADVIASGNYRLIIPVTERTVVPMRQLSALPQGEKIAIAPLDSLAVALEKDRTMMSRMTGILQMVKDAASDVGRGETAQVILLDGEGWFVATQISGELFLICAASRRAKLGQLLFHMRKMRSWVLKLDL